MSHVVARLYGTRLLQAMKKCLAVPQVKDEGGGWRRKLVRRDTYVMQCLVTYPPPDTPWLAGSPEIEVSWDGHKDLLLHPDPVPVEDQACRRHVDLRLCMRPMVAEESGAGERSKWLLL